MTGNAPTPGQVLAAARTFTASPSGGWGASWSRATAFLTRQALEEGVAQVWTGDLAGLSDCPFRQQLLCLPTYLDDPGLAQQVAMTWYGLSGACHAHPYDLAPTLAELEHWMTITGHLLEHVRHKPLSQFIA